MRRKITTRKKGQNRLAMGMIAVVVVILIVVVSVRSASLKKDKAELDQREQDLQEQITGQEEYAEDLDDLEKYMQTDEFVEETAKEKLGLVYEDELIFKIGD
jgi:cell division protein DivIC